MADLSIANRPDNLFDFGPDGLKMHTDAIDPQVFSRSFLHDGPKKDQLHPSSLDQFAIELPEPLYKKRGKPTDPVLAKPVLPPPEKEDKPIPRIVVTPPPPKTQAKQAAPVTEESVEIPPQVDVSSSSTDEPETTLQVAETAQQEESAPITEAPMAAISAEENVSPQTKKRKSSALPPTPQEAETITTHATITGRLWAQIIDNIFDTRRACQENANDLLHVQVKKRKVLDEKIIDNIREKEAKKAEGEKWDFYTNLAECFWISGALAGGIALQGVGITTGNPQAIWEGGKMTVGALLYLTSYSLKQIGYESQLNSLIAWAGSALIAHGFINGFGLFAREIPKTIVTGVSSGLALTKGFTAAQKQHSIADMHQLEGENSRFATERQENLDAVKKTAGGLKISDLTKLARAASNQEEERAKLMGRILEGSKG